MISEQLQFLLESRMTRIGFSYLLTAITIFSINEANSQQTTASSFNPTAPAASRTTAVNVAQNQAGLCSCDYDIVVNASVGSLMKSMTRNDTIEFQSFQSFLKDSSCECLAESLAMEDMKREISILKSYNLNNKTDKLEIALESYFKAYVEDNEKLKNETLAIKKSIREINETKEEELEKAMEEIEELKAEVRKLRTLFRTEQREAQNETQNLKKRLGEFAEDYASTQEKLKRETNELRSSIENVKAKTDTDSQNTKKEVEPLKKDSRDLKNRVRRLETTVKNFDDEAIPARLSTSSEKFFNETMRLLPTRCKEIKQASNIESTAIHPLKLYYDVTPFLVNCSDGGWIVIQRRTSGNLDFRQDYRQYTEGFGDRNGDFWLGLEIIHRLVSQAPYKLRIEMRLEKDPTKFLWAEYNHFYIEDESNKFRLVIGDYSGDAGDHMRSNNGVSFSTHERDHDTHGSYNCASNRAGGWWYTDCGTSGLNNRFTDLFIWGQALIYSQMMIQPHV